MTTWPRRPAGPFSRAGQPLSVGSSDLVSENPGIQWLAKGPAPERRLYRLKPPAKALVGSAMAPLGLGRRRLIEVGQPAKLEAQLVSPQAFAAPTALPLTHVERLVARLAGVGAMANE